MPRQNDLAGLSRIHRGKSLFKFGVREPVCDYRMQVEAGFHHRNHLVPCLIHLSSVYALQREPLENDIVPVNHGARAGNAEKRHLSPVAHMLQQLIQCRAAAAHFAGYVKSFYDVLLFHDLVEILIPEVDRCRCAHVLGEVQPVVVHVGNHHVLCAVVRADARRHHADRTGAGDQHILSDHIEHRSGVERIAVGVEKGHNILVDAVRNDDNIGSRYAEVLGKRTVTINADTFCVFAPLPVAGAAVAAAAAHDMPLSRYNLPHMIPFHPGAERSDLPHVLMADRHRRANMRFGPGVPIIDMNICAADCRLVYLDQDFSDTHFRYGYAPKFQPLPCRRFYKCIHRLWNHP